MAGRSVQGRGGGRGGSRRGGRGGGPAATPRAPVMPAMAVPARAPTHTPMPPTIVSSSALRQLGSATNGQKKPSAAAAPASRTPSLSAHPSATRMGAEAAVHRAATSAPKANVTYPFSYAHNQPVAGIKPIARRHMDAPSTGGTSPWDSSSATYPPPQDGGGGRGDRNTASASNFVFGARTSDSKGYDEQQNEWCDEFGDQQQEAEEYGEVYWGEEQHVDEYPPPNDGDDIYDEDYVNEDVEAQEQSKRKSAVANAHGARKKLKTATTATVATEAETEPAIEKQRDEAPVQPPKQPKISAATIDDCFELLLGLTSKIPKNWSTAVNRETYLRSLEVGCTISNARTQRGTCAANAIPQLILSQDKHDSVPIFTAEVALDYAMFIHSCIFRPIRLTAFGGRFETYQPKTPMLRALLEQLDLDEEAGWEENEEDPVIIVDSEPEREVLRATFTKSKGKARA